MIERHVNIKSATPAAIEEAGAVLRAGKLVAFPTETVYGLGADATDDDAVAGIFEAKGRPTFNPLIVHVSSIAMAETLAEIDDRARAVMAAFWPGPLTLVLPRRADCPASRLVSAGLPTIAVRMPSHTVGHALIEAAGCPIAAPSANRSGAISPTTADHVAASLGDRVDMILDGGPCDVGLESTVVSLAGEVPAILRPGTVTLTDLIPVLQMVVFAVNNDKTIQSPGQLASHYAPDATVRLNATDKRPGELLLGFGAVDGADANLSPSGDLREAAAHLFALLHDLDARGPVGIAVSPIPEEGLGLAINDRLQRAAAPREDR